MAPSRWDDEEEDSTPPSSPPAAPAIRRGKFDDEEEDSDVIESWDAADDSETEREKAKKAAAAQAKAEAEAKANKKSRSQRIEEKRMEAMRRRQEEEDESSEEEEDEATKRDRLRRTEKDSDLKHAEALFGDIGISNNRSAGKPVTLTDPSNPANSIELSSLKIFQPTSKAQFNELRDTLVPLVTANTSKPHYTLFMQEFTKALTKDLPSDQIKRIASGLTTLSNEKMKEEKAAEKGGKKTKAAKTKVVLNASRDTSLKADTTAYDDDGLDDGDFM